MFEYDKDSQKAAEELDKYDLTQVLSDCYDNGTVEAWDIQHEGILVKYPELEDAMDNLTLDEFIEYIQKRYNVVFDEVITYRMRYIQKQINGGDKGAK